jgi:hypothetical protein
MSLAGELAGPIQLVVHRGDGKRFVMRADEKLTAFVICHPIS